MFSELFEVPPAPPRRERVGSQVAQYSALIDDLGSVDAAVDAVIAGLSDGSGEPSEAVRLQRLYRLAYSAEELRWMIRATFHRLGLAMDEE